MGGGGGFLSSLDPTGNNFLGMGNTVGRIAGDVMTGGLGEFGRPDSFGLPPSIAGPLKIGAGTVGGGALMGPAGSFLGGTLGGLAGGNPIGGLVGGGIGGLLQSLIAGGGTGGSGGIDPGRLALGGSLLGLGLAQDTGIPDIQLPSNSADQAAIQRQMQAQRGLTGQASQEQQSLNQAAMGQGNDLISQALGRQGGLNTDYMNQLQGIDKTQNDLLGQRMQSQRDQLMNQLTTGPEGEAFREKYNNLGLLNSGAFNTGLANQFGNLAAQQQQDILNQGIAQQNQLAGAAGQGYGNLSGLGSQGYQNLQGLGSQGFQNMSDIANQGNQLQSQLGIGGLQRQFGLEDLGTQANLARNLGQAQQKADLQKTLLGLSGNIFGGGFGGGGGGQGGGGGGGGGGLFGGDSGFLSSLGAGTGNLISQILQKFRGGGNTGGPLSSDDSLNLIDSSYGGLRQSPLGF